VALPVAVEAHAAAGAKRDDEIVKEEARHARRSGIRTMLGGCAN